MSNEERPGTALNPFGSKKIAERASSAAAEAATQREVAEATAAMMIARRFPRDQVAATDRILQACARNSLAEDAVYQYGRGGSDVSGPSIRLAEVLAQNWGNLECGVKELSRHDGYSEVMAYAVDLETGFRDSKVFQVKHWRDTKRGGYVVTDERDIYEIVANQGARRKRACILTVIPGDVVDSAVHQCEVTLKTKIEINEEYLKKIIESFAEIGVSKDQLEKRIQRRLDTITPALALQLRRIYTSIRDGMSGVSEWFDPVDETETEKKEKVFESAKERLAAAARERAGATPPPPPEPDPTEEDEKNLEPEPEPEPDPEPAPSAPPPSAPPPPTTQKSKSASKPPGTSKPKGDIATMTKVLAKIAAAKDVDTLGAAADEGNLFEWSAADLSKINGAYVKRLEELGD